MISATSVSLYGFETVTLLSLATVFPAVEELENETVKLTGGFCAQSKKKPVMGWKGCEDRSTVSDVVVLAESLAHFVLAAPSTAEKGN